MTRTVTILVALVLAVAPAAPTDTRDDNHTSLNSTAVSELVRDSLLAGDSVLLRGECDGVLLAGDSVLRIVPDDCVLLAGDSVLRGGIDSARRQPDMAYA